MDVTTAEPLVYMAGHDDWVRGTVFSADGKSIFSVSRDKTVKQTDVATERFVGNVTTHTPGILSGGQNSIAVRPSKTELLVGGADGKAKLFRQATKAAPAGGGNPNQIREFKEQIEEFFCIFNPKGNLGFAGVVLMVKVKYMALKLILASKCGPRSLITHQFMPFVLRPMAKKLQSVDTMAKSDFFPLLQENLNVSCRLLRFRKT